MSGSYWMLRRLLELVVVRGRRELTNRIELLVMLIAAFLTTTTGFVLLPSGKSPQIPAQDTAPLLDHGPSIAINTVPFDVPIIAVLRVDIFRGRTIYMNLSLYADVPESGY